jgi:hypothetical protein
MRITSDGNVGVGTTSPTEKLTVAGSVRITGQASNFFAGAAGLNIDRINASGLIRIYGVAGSGGVVGDLALGTDSTERMRITAGGQVQITQSAQTYSDGLRIISGSNRWTEVISGSSLVLGYNEGDRGLFDSSTGVYTPLSDKNKKKDFEVSTIGLNEILNLKPTLYRMKTDSVNDEKQLGFIAQEVQEFIPQAYVESGEEENKFIGLNHIPIIAALVNSIKEQNEILEQLKAEIEILKTK